MTLTITKQLSSKNHWCTLQYQYFLNAVFSMFLGLFNSAIPIEKAI